MLRSALNPFRLAAAVCFAVSTLFAGSAQAAVAPSDSIVRVVAVDPEHARLTAMCGIWSVDMTLWIRPGGAPLSVKATSTINSLLNGLFIEEKIEGAIGGTSFTTMAWTGYNPEAHQYEATRISSSTPVRIAETGTWNEQSKQIELKATYLQAGETWTQRTVIQQSSPDTMVATSYLSFGKVAEWKGVEIRYVRQSK